jgi:peptide chain release factor
MSLWQLPYHVTRFRNPLGPVTRLFTTTPATLKKADQNPPRMKIPDEDIYCHYMSGWGNGGQVINKTMSAVHLKHIPTGIVVKSQPTRSRTQNLKIARQILADKVDEHLNGKESRPAIKQEKKRKKQASADKKKRRKYRALETVKGERDLDGDEDPEDADGQAESESSEGLKSTERTQPKSEQQS